MVVAIKILLVTELLLFSYLLSLLLPLLLSFLSIYLSIHQSIHQSLPIYLHIYPSIKLSIYLSTYLSIHLSIHLSIYPSINVSFHPSIYLPIYLSIHPSIYPSIHLSIHLSFHLSTYLPIYLPIYPSIYLGNPSTYLSIHPSTYQSIYLSIYPSIQLSIYLFISLWIREREREHEYWSIVSATCGKQVPPPPGLGAPDPSRASSASGGAPEMDPVLVPFWDGNGPKIRQKPGVSLKKQQKSGEWLWIVDCQLIVRMFFDFIELETNWCNIGALIPTDSQDQTKFTNM